MDNTCDANINMNITFMELRYTKLGCRIMHVSNDVGHT